MKKILFVKLFIFLCFFASFSFAKTKIKQHDIEKAISILHESEKEKHFEKRMQFYFEGTEFIKLENGSQSNLNYEDVKSALIDITSNYDFDTINVDQIDYAITIEPNGDSASAIVETVKTIETRYNTMTIAETTKYVFGIHGKKLKILSESNSMNSIKVVK